MQSKHPEIRLCTLCGAQAQEAPLPQAVIGDVSLRTAQCSGSKRSILLPQRNMLCTFLLKHMARLLYLSFPTFERDLGRGNISLRKTTVQAPWEMATAPWAQAGEAAQRGVDLEADGLILGAVVFSNPGWLLPGGDSDQWGQVFWFFKKSQKSWVINLYVYVGSSLYKTLCQPNMLEGLGSLCLQPWSGQVQTPEN